MPDPKLATEVRECYRWLDMFDNSDNDGVSSELIATAKKVILEGYDLFIICNRNINKFYSRTIYNKIFTRLSNKRVSS